MILLCDENVGTGVPKALALVGHETKSIVGLGWRGRRETEWLPMAGEAGWLVLSCDKKMLLVPEERQAIVEAKVGIVFITSGVERPARVLKLLLTKWDQLIQTW